MKRTIFILLMLLSFHPSLSQIKDCRFALFIHLFETCKTNERYTDELIPKLENDSYSIIEPSFLNLKLGTNYPLDDLIYPILKNVNEFGYSLIFQSVNELNNRVGITLMLIGKSGDFIADQFLGDNYLFNLKETANIKRYYFKFINDTTLEVTCQTMDYSQFNLIEESYSYYAISKNGIYIIPNISKEKINQELLSSEVGHTKL